MFWVWNTYRSKRLEQRVLIAKQNKANQAKHWGDAPAPLGCGKWGIEHNGIITSSLGLGNFILFGVIQLMKKILFRHLIEVTALLNNTTSPPEEKGNYRPNDEKGFVIVEGGEQSTWSGRERKEKQINFIFVFFFHTNMFFMFSLFSVSLLMWVHSPGKLSRSWKFVALKGRGVFSILGLMLSTGFLVASENIDSVDLCASM